MKKTSILLCVLLLALCLAVPTFAAESNPRLVDNADLLERYEEAELLDTLDEISSRLKFDVVIVTTDTLGGKTPRAYADDYFDYNGYGYGADRDGILLLVSMEDRDWWISTSGFGIYAFTDDGIDYISDCFLSDLSDGYYADAFEIFATKCDQFVTQAREGAPFDSSNLPKEPFETFDTLIIAVMIGLGIGLIATGAMKAQLKTVRKQNSAEEYVRAGSMQVNQRSDLFLYRNVTRRAKPKSSSTHTSSSGRSHGGGGGKF